MSGVWVFKNGIIRLVENAKDDGQEPSSSGHRRKMLVYTPTGEMITSYAELEQKLIELGWERYYDDPNLIQFHKRATIELISLPKNFAQFKSMHMYDVVVKNRDNFEVKDNN